MGLDSECQLFRILPDVLSNKIEGSVYNGRKSKQFSFRELLRENMVSKLNQSQNCYIVDSMSLEICKLSRSTKSKNM